VVARVLGVLGHGRVGFLAFLIFTSNPFERLCRPPPKAATSTRCCRIRA
jgi:cytochrome c biogenesis factor